MPQILKELMDYFKIRLRLLKYETADRAIAIIAELVADLAIVVALTSCFIFFTVALAFFVGTILRSFWAGFGIITLLYISILFLGHLLKMPFQGRLIRMLINKILKNKNKHDR